jgi:hypothetical protein
MTSRTLLHVCNEIDQWVVTVRDGMQESRRVPGGDPAPRDPGLLPDPFL